MKKRKTFLALIVMIAALICLGGFSVTAYAGGGEETQPPVESTPQPTETPAPTSTPEPTPPPDPIRLTPDGNLTLVDDIDGAQAEDKQFITVVTKNGNYFYIIIDRAGDKDNVYFLNMVDEADLMALIDKDKKPAAPVVTQPDPQPTPPVTPEPKPGKESGSMGGILALVLIVAALGGGAFYYFKILKPKQGVKGSMDISELDELDFDDEDDYSDLGADAAEREDSEE